MGGIYVWDEPPANSNRDAVENCHLLSLGESQINA